MARVEDFLRDSLGIEKENTVVVANEDVAKPACVLASIKEEEVDKEEAVEEGAKVKDVVVPRTELPPSLQKLDAQRAALLKLGMDSGTDQISEKEEQKETDQEEEVTEGDGRRGREGLISRSRREELRKGGWEGERRVVMEEEDEDEIQKQRNRKRKGSVKDRLDWSDKVVKGDRVIQDRIDWSDKVVVVEEEHEAETFIENKETLNDQNFDKKLARPRMGMVADMVEAEQR